MKYYIITDTHFGHDKIKDHCSRPDGFEEIILNNIKNTVSENDVLIHLGDVAWSEQSMWNLKLASVSPFKRWLMLGNHDKQSRSWYYKRGWSFVGESCTLDVYGKRILFSHEPAKDGDYDINIHGHLHNTGHHDYKKTVRHLCFFIEHHYTPVNLERLISP